jgi:hypothetical protein
MHHRPIQFPPPRATPKDVAALVELLKRQKDWATAEQIGFLLGWSDRKVRRVASETDQIVSHPGSEGYKLEEKCSEEEVSHFGNSLRAQARKMIGRWLRVRARRQERQRSQGLLPL